MEWRRWRGRQISAQSAMQLSHAAHMHAAAAPYISGSHSLIYERPYVPERREVAAKEHRLGDSEPISPLLVGVGLLNIT